MGGRERPCMKPPCSQVSLPRNDLSPLHQYSPKEALKQSKPAQPPRQGFSMFCILWHTDMLLKLLRYIVSILVIDKVYHAVDVELTSLKGPVNKWYLLHIYNAGWKSLHWANNVAQIRVGRRRNNGFGVSFILNVSRFPPAASFQLTMGTSCNDVLPIW